MDNQSSSRSPVLVSNLRAALSHLYSSASSLQTTSQAHTYLIEFQTRNIRRKIQALVQKQNDTKKDQNQNQLDEARMNVLVNHAGSSFYAALSLLLPSMSHMFPNHNNNNGFATSINHETEQLFCAQTVLQRLRRVKLSEAIDFEMEVASNSSTSNPIAYDDFISKCNTYQVNEEEAYTQWKGFVSFHCQQLSTFYQNPEFADATINTGFVSLLNRVLQQYFDHQWNNSKTAKDFYDSRWGYGSEMEDKVKGELMLLVLTTITYYNMYVQLLGKQLGRIPSGCSLGPLMNTLTSAIAVIALRLRYTSSSVKNDQTLAISSNTTLHSLLGEQQQQPSSSSSSSSSSQTDSNIGATNDTPIVTMILQALEIVSQIAASLSIKELVPSIQTNDHGNEQLHQLLSQQTIHQCIYTQLSILPDALLGGNKSGGIRGRLSVDPKCIQFMTVELSNPATGIQVVMDTMRIILEQQQQLAPDPELHKMFLLTCQRWATFVPLPKDFVEHTLSYATNHILPTMNSSNTSMIQNAYCSYLISVFESACLTVEQIVALNVGLTIDSSGVGSKIKANKQPGRKRQSSKSKKRQQEKIHHATSNSLVNHHEKAEVEHHHRGMVAYHAAMLSWEFLYQMFQQCLSQSSHANFVAEGDGPVGCMCALVSACLPYVIKNQEQEQDKTGILLFVSNVMEALRMICSNDNSSIRALSFEHIPVIHSAIVKKTSCTVGGELTEIDICVAKNVVVCSIALAEQCAYPPNYFLNLKLDHDEELEIERNDVRDILRSVTNVNAKVPLQMLDYVLEFCHTKMTSAQNLALAPEPIVHILSSPAKSLDCLAKALPNFIGDSKWFNTIQQIIYRAIDSLRIACKQIMSAFQRGMALNQVFPISRLVCICFASFSPFFSSLQVNAQHLSDEVRCALQEVLGYFVSVVIESLNYVPELVDCSSLGDTVYDIRGAMRSPGGEDHVAAIALMRLVTAGDEITLAALTSAALSKNVPDVRGIFLDLSHLHDRLQSIETERGQGISFGKGVTPKSRRVLLKSICKIGIMISRKDPTAEEIIRSELYRLFRHPLTAIIAATSNSGISQASIMYCVCEATNDIASFPPEICSQLFQNKESPNEDILKGTQIIINTVVSGYKDLIMLQEPSDVAVEWGRMRGALLSLLRSCACPSLPQLAVEAIVALNEAECTSVLDHVLMNEKQFTSSIFTAPVISGEVVPAGAFLIVLFDVIANTLKRARANELNPDQVYQVLSGCSTVLFRCQETVFTAVKSRCPRDIRWEDPRTTICEAWFSAVFILLNAFRIHDIAENESFHFIVRRSMALCIHLIMSTKVEKEYSTKDAEDGLVSVEGPQSLKMINFLTSALRTQDIFTHTASLCQETWVLDHNSLERGSDPAFVGGAIISATILRSVSGGLPPWTVEYMPIVLKSLHQACGSTDSFCLAMAGGCDLRLCKTSASNYADILPGKKLAGFFLDTMKPKARESFLCSIEETFAKKKKDQTQVFRFLKVILKANCGGKKKATGFTLKPQSTAWECDRL